MVLLVADATVIAVVMAPVRITAVVTCVVGILKISRLGTVGALAVPIISSVANSDAITVAIIYFLRTIFITPRSSRWAGTWCWAGLGRGRRCWRASGTSTFIKKQLSARDFETAVSIFLVVH